MLSQDEVMAVAAKLSAMDGRPAIAKCMTCRQDQEIPRLRLIEGDALSPDAMRVARAYESATQPQRILLDAMADAITKAQE